MESLTDFGDLRVTRRRMLCFAFDFRQDVGGASGGREGAQIIIRKALLITK
ncbi:hypothetical protein PZN02_005619 [Sinorhizobium garamanticum]|uniref:Uncharacterized protein n=1 Tax=Sinorhizobium garamanticum TaxID=680247 RepID=A0ABY8DJ79_9HYPH|nr:hypothetical protein [Sinorhizobium garamanticum]WEX90248.1 hypothetical protein PZN02_005619 [Sinorhizobium garamanticum]